MPDNILSLLIKSLNGETSAEEDILLAEYRQENPQMDMVIREISDYWQKGKSNIVDESIFERHLDRLKAADPSLNWSIRREAIPEPDRIVKNNSKFRIFRMAVAAAAMLVLCFYIFLSGGLFEKQSDSLTKKAEMNVFKTGSGSRSRLALPDGSEIWVNANSTIYYDKGFGKTNRNIKLNGEAYFRVAKLKALPFCIETNKINITVTGTVFNVRSYDKESKAETSVFEGSVRVSNKGMNQKTFDLRKSDKLIVNEEDSEKIAITSPRNGQQKASENMETQALTLSKIEIDPTDSLVVETAWMYATLAFSDESFEQIAQKMENWYGVSIVFEKDSLKKIRFTGRFTKETIYEALDALRFTAPFQYKELNNRFAIY